MPLFMTIFPALKATACHVSSAYFEVEVAMD